MIQEATQHHQPVQNYRNKLLFGFDVKINYCYATEKEELRAVDKCLFILEGCEPKPSFFKVQRRDGSPEQS